MEIPVNRTIQASFPASTAAFPDLHRYTLGQHNCRGCCLSHKAVKLRLFYQDFEKKLQNRSRPPWQNSANNWLRACQLAFWQWAVVGVAGKAMSQIVWAAGVHAVIFLFCRIKYTSMINEQTDFTQVEGKKRNYGRELQWSGQQVHEAGSRQSCPLPSAFTGGSTSGDAAICVQPVCSLCKPGQGRMRPGVRGCPAPSISFGHQLDPNLGKLVLW